ncbi:MAG: response regulator [Rubellimicrobium sp.]|nr:response regulator [Rubellimicrobium sp.]
MQTTDKRQHRILLAEDDEISQGLVKMLLGETGEIDLTIAGDGRTALVAALTERFDLMIIDQNLPQITGDRIVRQIRAGQGRNARTPILRFSASIQAPGCRGTGPGFETLLPKPIAGEIFVSTVRGLLAGGAKPGETDG